MNLIPPIVNIYFAGLAIIINCIFAILVMTRTSRDLRHIIFLFVCISVVIWNSAEMLRLIAGERSWSYCALVGSAMLPTLSSHFLIATISPQRRNKRWITTAYTFSGILALTATIIFINPSSRWISDDGYWDVAYFVLLFPFFIYGMFVMLRKMISTTAREEKSHLRYLLLAAMIGLVTVLSDHLQTLQVSVPALGHIGSVFYSSILAIGLFKHRTIYDVLAQTRMKLDMLNEMSAGIAHEIRNPLSSIKGAARILLKSGNTDAAGREYLIVITEEVERLDAILTNYQHLTKPLKIEREAIAVNTVIEKTVRLTEMDSRGLRISLDLSNALPLTQADPQSLKQVFLNLIKNAMEACDPEGELTIRTEYSPPWIIITFLDTGPGIRSDVLPHIFEPFVSTKIGGMGLGLAICKRIVESNDGSMEAGNNALKGARFSIFLTANE